MRQSLGNREAASEDGGRDGPNGDHRQAARQPSAELPWGGTTDSKVFYDESSRCGAPAFQISRTEFGSIWADDCNIAAEPAASMVLRGLSLSPQENENYVDENAYEAWRPNLAESTSASPESGPRSEIPPLTLPLSGSPLPPGPPKSAMRKSAPYPRVPKLALPTPVGDEHRGFSVRFRSLETSGRSLGLDTAEGITPAVTGEVESDRSIFETLREQLCRGGGGAPVTFPLRSDRSSGLSDNSAESPEALAGRLIRVLPVRKLPSTVPPVDSQEASHRGTLDANKLSCVSPVVNHKSYQGGPIGLVGPRVQRGAALRAYSCNSDSNSPAPPFGNLPERDVDASPGLYLRLFSRTGRRPSADASPALARRLRQKGSAVTLAGLLPPGGASAPGGSGANACRKTRRRNSVTAAGAPAVVDFLDRAPVRGEVRVISTGGRSPAWPRGTSPTIVRQRQRRGVGRSQTPRAPRGRSQRGRRGSAAEEQCLRHREDGVPNALTAAVRLITSLPASETPRQVVTSEDVRQALELQRMRAILAVQLEALPPARRELVARIGGLRNWAFLLRSRVIRHGVAAPAAEHTEVLRRLRTSAAAAQGAAGGVARSRRKLRFAGPARKRQRGDGGALSGAADLTGGETTRESAAAPGGVPSKPRLLPESPSAPRRGPSAKEEFLTAFPTVADAARGRSATIVSFAVGGSVNPRATSFGPAAGSDALDSIIIFDCRDDDDDDKSTSKYDSFATSAGGADRTDSNIAPDGEASTAVRSVATTRSGRNAGWATARSGSTARKGTARVTAASRGSITSRNQRPANGNNLYRRPSERKWPVSEGALVSSRGAASFDATAAGAAGITARSGSSARGRGAARCNTTAPASGGVSLGTSGFLGSTLGLGHDVHNLLMAQSAEGAAGENGGGAPAMPPAVLNPYDRDEHEFCASNGFFVVAASLGLLSPALIARFPWYLYYYSSGAFLGVYVFVSLVCVAPVMAAIVGLGQLTQGGCIRALHAVHPRARGVSAVALLFAVVCAVAHASEATLQMRYLSNSFALSQPWKPSAMHALACRTYSEDVDRCSWGGPSCMQNELESRCFINPFNFAMDFYTEVTSSKAAQTDVLLPALFAGAFWLGGFILLIKSSSVLSFYALGLWSLATFAVCCLFLFAFGTTLAGASSSLSKFLSKMGKLNCVEWEWHDLADPVMWSFCLSHAFSSIGPGIAFLFSISGRRRPQSAIMPACYGVIGLNVLTSLIATVAVFPYFGFLISGSDPLAIIIITDTPRYLLYATGPLALSARPGAPVFCLLFFTACVGVSGNAVFAQLAFIREDLADVKWIGNHVPQWLLATVIALSCGILAFTDIYGLGALFWYCWDLASIYSGASTIIFVIAITVGWFDSWDPVRRRVGAAAMWIWLTSYVAACGTFIFLSAFHGVGRATPRAQFFEHITMALGVAAAGGAAAFVCAVRFRRRRGGNRSNASTLSFYASAFWWLACGNVAIFRGDLNDLVRVRRLDGTEDIGGCNANEAGGAEAGGNVAFAGAPGGNCTTRPSQLPRFFGFSLRYLTPALAAIALGYQLRHIRGGTTPNSHSVDFYAASRILYDGIINDPALAGAVEHSYWALLVSMLTVAAALAVVPRIAACLAPSVKLTHQQTFRGADGSKLRKWLATLADLTYELRAPEGPMEDIRTTETACTLPPPLPKPRRPRRRRHRQPSPEGFSHRVGFL